MSRFRSTKRFNGFSTAFRQWRSVHSHCQYLHGYSISFKVWFEGEVDERNWVADFGDLDAVKHWLADLLDHTTVVAEDDPLLDLYKEMETHGLIQLRTVPHVGCERFAELVFNFIDQYIQEKTAKRIRVVQVECFEDGTKNSAIYLE